MHRGPSTNLDRKQTGTTNQLTSSTLSQVITQPHLDINPTVPAQEEEGQPQHHTTHPKSNPHSLSSQTTPTSDSNAPEYAPTLHNMGATTRPAGTKTKLLLIFPLLSSPQIAHPENAVGQSSKGPLKITYLLSTLANNPFTHWQLRLQPSTSGRHPSSRYRTTPQAHCLGSA